MALALWLLPVDVVAAETKPPVFVFLIDAVRADCLKSFNQDIPVGGEIDRLAHDGIVFEAARSSSSWTRTAVATLLTGLPAERHKVYGRGDILDGAHTTLAEILHAHGYRTAAWSSNPNILPVWGFQQGFDQFFDAGASTRAGLTKSDVLAVLRPVREWMRNNPTDASFLYIHLMDAHAPYLPEESDLARVRADARLLAAFPGEGAPDPGGEARESHQRYLAEIAGMDREIGAFLDELRRRGIYDRALILLLADHGEEFLEHGQLHHGKTLYEEVLRVPAVLKLPGNAAAGTRVSRPVTTADFMPTILRALELPVPENLGGIPLWNGHAPADPGERPLLSTLKLDEFEERAVLESGWKLIVDSREGERLYDLASDPHERAPRHDTARARERQRRLAAVEDGEEEGWHIRLCGGDTPGQVRLIVTTDGILQASRLEPRDSFRTLAAENGRSRYDLTLSYAKRLREGHPDQAGAFIRDEDDLRVVATDGIPPAVAMSGTLTYALGQGSRLSTVTSLDLRTPAEEAVVRGQVECFARGATARSAYLRIWYVPAAAKHDAAQIDPAVRERLRALGYE